MYSERTPAPLCFATARMMSGSPQPTSETLNWAGDMDGVAQRRDRECFMRIYDYFMPRLCVYLRGLGAPDGVGEELAQESLLRLWLHAEHFNPAQSALSTWLFRIARNLHIDRVRHERGWLNAQAVVEQAATLDAPGRSSAEQFADDARLRQRVNELPAVQARLVRMSYFEARSHGEISQALGMPLGTVKSHLRRAFLQLQSKVGAG